MLGRLLNHVKIVTSSLMLSLFGNKFVQMHESQNKIINFIYRKNFYTHKTLKISSKPSNYLYLY